MNSNPYLVPKAEQIDERISLLRNIVRSIKTIEQLEDTIRQLENKIDEDKVDDKTLKLKKDLSTKKRLLTIKKKELNVYNHYYNKYKTIFGPLQQKTEENILSPIRPKPSNPYDDLLFLQQVARHNSYITKLEKEKNNLRHSSKLGKKSKRCSCKRK